MISNTIITPSDPKFYQTLSNPPPFYMEVAKKTGDTALVANLDTGILEQVSDRILEEYLWGGEYDEVEKANCDFFGQPYDQEVVFY